MNVINFLKKHEAARKVFGKRELKIIEKQLWGMDLTQSEKNRLSRDIRKKLVFIKDVSKFSEMFGLKKGAIIKEIIEETNNTIKESKFFNKIRRIILYGSAVENKLTFKSDIDIVVEFSDISLKEATLFRKNILGKTHQNIDIQVYNYLPKKIKSEIDNKGRILYKDYTKDGIKDEDKRQDRRN